MRPAITQSMRSAVADRAGCRPGMMTLIRCTYCESPIIVDRTEPKRTRFLDRHYRSTPELDHIIPLARGGPHTVENLTPSCQFCNRSKCAR
jgi:5-methylcytosine-specific restriction endonuclease McrA